MPGKIAARAIDTVVTRSDVLPGPIRAAVNRAGRTVAEARIGFKLASRYVAFGPFDNSDGQGLERAYVNETSFDEETISSRHEFSRVVLNASGDLVDVDGSFGASGPLREVFEAAMIQPCFSAAPRKLLTMPGPSALGEKT